MAIAALCYVYSVVAILLLLLLLGIEMVYLVVAARFGLAGVVTPLIKRHSGLFSVFVRSFWRRKHTDYRLLITEDEAPRLFASVEGHRTPLQHASAEGSVGRNGCQRLGSASWIPAGLRANHSCRRL